jgi:very-short-patch-repair endonuclease
MTPGRMTGIERMMARALDELGYKYEREVRFGIYRVDFLLKKHRLVIECDGLWWHSKPLRKAKDDRKDSYLNACGLIVFRAAEFAIRQDAKAIARAALKSAGVEVLR